MSIDAERLLRSFIELTKIESPSFEEQEVADYLVRQIRSLGWQAQADRNIILRIPGSAAAPTLLFCAHMDTVEPQGKLDPVVRSVSTSRQEETIVTNRNATVLGADDKAGVAAILEMLRVLKEDTISHGPLEIVFTFGEEKGLLGMKAVDFSEIQAKYGFAVDGDGPVGTVILKAPYYDRLKAVFRGKAAHAGVDPEQGVNAIRAASLAVAKTKQGRIDDETTVNIGKIKGGRAANIVPDETYVEGEARSHKLEKLEAQSQAIVRAFESGAREVGAQVEVDVRREFDGFDLSEADPIVELTFAAIRKLGLEPRPASSGGGSDTNVLNSKGICSVNLGTGAEKVHSPEEFISVKELCLLPELLVAIATGAAEEGEA